MALRIAAISVVVLAAVAVHYLAMGCFAYCAWLTAVPDQDLAYWQSRAKMWFIVLLGLLAMDVAGVIWVLYRSHQRTAVPRI